MKKIYVYLHHQGFDFYLKDRKLSAEECYCPYCEDSDELIGVYDDGAELADKMKSLFAEGYDFISDISYPVPDDYLCP